MVEIEKSIPQIFFDRVKEHPDRVLFQNKEKGKWRDISWKEASSVIQNIGFALIALGLKTGERVCILSENRLDWLYVDLGIQSAGGVTVGIYPSNLQDEVEYIVDHCEARFIFVSNPLQLRKLKDRKKNLPKLEKIILFDAESELDEDVMSYYEFKKLGEEYKSTHPNEVSQRISELGPDSLLTLIYTSGTTGPPKGAMLTHGNIIWVYHALENALEELIDVEYGDLTLSYLPYAHAYERIGGIYFGIFRGITIAIAEGLDKLSSNIQETKPTILLGAPRVYEKINSALLQTIDKGPILKRKLFYWALKVGEESAPYRIQKKMMPFWILVRYKAAKLLVFNQIKKRFGGRIKFMVSAGAPIAPELIKFFYALDILILEGYGLTETSAPSTINLPSQIKFGTVGKALKGVEIKIAPDGEILIKGGNVFKGYFKDPESTKLAFDEEGWFHSGDVGEIDEEGFLRITDRKKDLIITAGGKNIAPQNIENLFKTDMYISEFLCYGDRKKFLTGLITLNEEAIVQWAKEQGIQFSNFAELSQHPEVYKFIEKRVQELNRHLPSYSTIKRFVILPHQFTQEAGEVTPTLKLKRKKLYEKYKDLLESLYEGLEDGAI